MDSTGGKDPRTFIDYKTIPILSKYFEDGTIEEWLTDDDGAELYLIRSKRHPSGKSPIVGFKPIDRSFYDPEPE